MYMIEREKTLGQWERWDGCNWGRDLAPELYETYGAAEAVAKFVDAEYAFVTEWPDEA